MKTSTSSTYAPSSGFSSIKDLELAMDKLCALSKDNWLVISPDGMVYKFSEPGEVGLFLIRQ